MFIKVLSLDVETTGLEINEARITEIGACLFDIDNNLPILLLSRLIKSEVKIPTEVTLKTKLTNELIEEFGVSIKDGLAELSYLAIKGRPDYILAHNGNSFDRPIIMAEIKRHSIDMCGFESIPWIDSKTDIPFEIQPDSMRLNHLAMDAGFINPFQHRALFDCMTTLKVISSFKFEDIVAYSKIPKIKIRALTDYHQKDLAKARSYQWDSANKIWTKEIGQDKLQIEIDKCKGAGFDVVVL